jgi:hypothetical protein
MPKRCADADSRRFPDEFLCVKILWEDARKEGQIAGAVMFRAKPFAGHAA